ncbi:hypothetical protein G6M86_03650 [Agrobacterium tumefaciens]|uniref:Uncharacterized protein n=1 Tax=Agrobacterium tumefaciens TaxID=358 RepID=A0AAJ4T8Y2_AGRTU|nr:hypothetical protein G6M86_03650 [Agrobacterium tumefaciens]
MTEKPSYWGDAINELVYCVRKYGEFTFDPSHRSRLIVEAKSFSELQVILAVFALSEPDQVIDELMLAIVGGHMNQPIPDIDGMRRWPWDVDDEVDV